jgi:hypothetical protein
MRGRVVLGGVLSAVCLSASASAQTARLPPPLDRVYVGAGTGVAAVQNAGGLAEGFVGWRQSARLDLTAQAMWLQDLVTRRRLDLADGLAAYLQQSDRNTQVSIDAPGLAAIGGVRWTLFAGSLRPYLTAGGGVARIALRPAVTVAGVDVTARLADVGVSLGSDLTGTSYHPAISGGLGVQTTRGRWLVDAVVRLLSIRMAGQPTDAALVSVSLARRF